MKVRQRIRVTGIDTPWGGLSWEYTALEEPNDLSKSEFTIVSAHTGLALTIFDASTFGRRIRMDSVHKAQHWRFIRDEKYIDQYRIVTVDGKMALSRGSHTTDDSKPAYARAEKTDPNALWQKWRFRKSDKKKDMWIIESVFDGRVLDDGRGFQEEGKNYLGVCPHHGHGCQQFSIQCYGAFNP